jgi:hypothetical protein
MALQPGVGLGLHYNTSPSLSIPCSISPFVYSPLSQVRRHIIQPSCFWSSSASCCIQLSVHLFGDLLHIGNLSKNRKSSVCLAELWEPPSAGLHSAHYSDWQYVVCAVSFKMQFLYVIESPRINTTRSKANTGFLQMVMGSVRSRILRL